MKTLSVSLLIALCSLAGTGAAAGPHLQGGSPATSNSRANERVFDRNKGALYALYARALRDQPNLGGKVVIEVDIDSAGVATDCRVKSSELKSPDLERKLCERFKLMRFDPQTPTTLTKVLTFFGAAKPAAGNPAS